MDQQVNQDASMSHPDKGGVEMQRLHQNSSGNDDKLQVMTNGSAGPNEGDKDGAPDEFEKPIEVKQSFFRRCRKKCCKKDPKAAQAQKPVGLESNPNLRVKNTIKRIVNGRFVLTLMTFVTIFALIGVSIFILTATIFKLFSHLGVSY